MTIDAEITAYLANFAKHGATEDQLRFGRECAWAGVLIAAKQNEASKLVNAPQIRRELAAHITTLRKKK
jgi:hypothetical protein